MMIESITPTESAFNTGKLYFVLTRVAVLRILSVSFDDVFDSFRMSSQQFYH